MFGSLIVGPLELISVSSLLFNFILIRLYPSSNDIKSCLQLDSSNCLIISFPVNPAMNPVAIVSIPRLFNTRDISFLCLILFLPQYY